MGIKFLCPNGHKLHVKFFLGGKKAICPKCGARVIVPAESPAFGEPGALERLAGGAEQDAEVALEESLVDDAMEAMAASDATAGLEAHHQGGAQRSATVVDPIDEAPGAVWYVRPVGGGQYGPASALIMRNWLIEGRVGANSLVWRAGWTDWRSAEATFPQFTQSAAPAANLAATSKLAAGNGMPPLPLGHAVQNLAPSAPQVQESSTMPPLAQVARRRRRRNDLSLIASAVLVVTSVILVIVLVLVFRGQSTSGGPKPEERPPQESLN
ncbi:MAG: GYF domain-containing protein [Pirellulales bacterium]